MPSRITDIALLGLSVLGFAAAGPLLTPYADGECTNQVPAWTYTSRNGTRYTNQPFDTGAGVSAFGNSTLKGNYEAYSNIKISTPANPGSLGSNIYWKVTGLDDTCRLIMMAPYAQTQHGTNIPGNIILNAGSKDTCYYTDPGETMYLSFCCGTGDCSAFSVGETVLNTKRDLPVKHVGGPAISIAKQMDNSHKRDSAHAIGSGPSKSLASHFNKAQAKNKRGPQPKLHRGGSLSARALAQIHNRNALGVFRQGEVINQPKTCGDKDVTCWNQEWAKCKITASPEPISMPGEQQSVSSWVNCNSGTSEGCEISKSTTTTHSSEVSVSQSESDTTGSSTSSSTGSESTNTVETTNTDGYSLSVGASIGWGPFSVSTDATTSGSTTTDNTNTQVSSSLQTSSQSFSSTVANTTGHALTEATGETVTQTFTVMPGGYAILTFLPFYDCWTVTVDCGHDWKGPRGTSKTVSTQICTPQIKNGAAQGSYSLLYSNAAN